MNNAKAISGEQNTELSNKKQRNIGNVNQNAARNAAHNSQKYIGRNEKSVEVE